MNVVFDLSEVLIRGLLGIEAPVARLTGCTEASVLPRFWGDNLDELILGRRSEVDYLEHIIRENAFSCGVSELQSLLRENFQIANQDAIATARALTKRQNVFLLSDHAREWAEFILQHHGWLGSFKACAFSFQFGKSKRGTGIFDDFLRRHELRAEETVFIDDNPKNLESARRCGIDTVLFESAAQMTSALEARGL